MKLVWKIQANHTSSSINVGYGDVNTALELYLPIQIASGGNGSGDSSGGGILKKVLEYLV